MQNVLEKENEVIKVKLNTLVDVKNFVSITEKTKGEVIVTSGHYTVDGKSLMGILSLALNYEVNVKVEDIERDEFVQKLKGVGILS